MADDIGDKGIIRDGFRQYFQDDAAKRTQWQHEFTISGLKSLILINGGATVSLLTYIGNHRYSSTVYLRLSVIFYVLALTVTVFAYLIAYLSQGAAMRLSNSYALKLHSENTVTLINDADDKKFERKANRYILSGIILVLLSLLSFVAGSIMAMLALT